MIRAILVVLLLLEGVLAGTAASEALVSDATPSASSALGSLYRQARSDQYYTRRYAGEGLSSGSLSGGIGRPDPLESRDAAYFESRCITCDPNKSTASSIPDRGGYRTRPRYDWNDYDYEDRRYNPVGGYRDRGYDDYERGRSPGYDYDPSYYRFGRYDIRPLYYMSDRYDRDRGYDRNYDRLYYDRGNGYDNLESRYPYESRGESRYYSPRPRPSYEEPSYVPRYDRRPSFANRYDTMSYDRYEPQDRYYKPVRPMSEDRYYDRLGGRGSGGYGGSVGGTLAGAQGGGAGGGYYSGSASGSWGPGYDKGYASAWNYAGTGGRDNWRDRDFNRDRDYNRDRDPGYYRPRDYFYDSTAAPGASRGTSYLHDRPESSTPSNNIGDESATNSPKSQDSNKVYKD